MADLLIYRSLGVGLIFTIFLGCGTWVHNPSEQEDDDQEIHFDISTLDIDRNEDGSVSFIDSLGRTFTLNKALVSLASIHLESAERGTDDRRGEFDLRKFKREFSRLIDDIDDLFEDTERDLRRNSHRSEQILAERDTKLLELRQKAQTLRQNMTEIISSRTKDVYWPGPFTYDFIDQSLSPQPSIQQQIVGQFDEYQIEFIPAFDVDTTDPMFQKTLMVEGKVEIEGQSQELKISISFVEEVRKSFADPFQFSEGSFQLLLDVRKWLDGLTFPTAEDGIISIEGRRSEAVEMLIERIEKSLDD